MKASALLQALGEHSFVPACGYGGSRMGKCPPSGEPPFTVASIFSASPGSSWRNRLVIRVFIFPAVSDVGKSRMLRLERFRAAGKDALGTGLGTQPSGHWVPACRKTKQDGPGTAKPSGVFNLPQPWRLSKPDNLTQFEDCFSKHNQSQKKIFSQNPPPQPLPDQLGAPPVSNDPSQSQI